MSKFYSHQPGGVKLFLPLLNDIFLLDRRAIL